MVTLTLATVPNVPIYSTATTWAVVGIVPSETADASVHPLSFNPSALVAETTTPFQ